MARRPTETRNERLPRHPGAALRRTKTHPKGRQADANVRREITNLIGEQSRARDLLIVYLHEIQDIHGCLPAAHLAALAEELPLSQAEIYEVASFYAHFDILAEGENPSPALTVRVCDSLTCEMFGGGTNFWKRYQPNSVGMCAAFHATARPVSPRPDCSIRSNPKPSPA